jgi:hypothetical protein
MRTVVIDTNVLLSRPDVVNDFPGVDVVIPETVLAEIDKLKTARVDPDLRYHGRLISRILFDLSEQGPLNEGVELAGGGDLRVVGLREGAALPEGLTGRNADDRILAVALQLRAEGAEVTLVTNDLNMLLKAQSFGLTVERVEDEESFVRRFIVRPSQRYRAPLTILGISLAVFAAVLYLTVFSPYAPGSQAGGVAALPSEYVEQLSSEQQQMLSYLFRLQVNPRDTDAHRSLATVYDTLAQQNPAYLPYAIRHWEYVTTALPNDGDALTQLATDYFHAQRTDQAISTVKKALAVNPDNVNANYVLGVFYSSTTPKRYQDAANQFARVIQLTESSPSQTDALGRARTMLEQVKKDAAAAGQPITTNGGTL